MRTLQHQCFTDINLLKSINGSRLLQFLRPYAEYLAKRGVPIPDASELTEDDFIVLAGIFDSPNVDTPTELLSSLHLVSELANPTAMERLLDRIEVLTETFNDHNSPLPADVAIEAYINSRFETEQFHREQTLSLRRTFNHYQATSSSPPNLPTSLADAINPLHRELDRYYIGKKCGPGTQIATLQRVNQTIFTISHGSPLHLQGILENGKRNQLVFHPEQEDIVIYDHLVGELQVNAATALQKDLYRRMFGKYLFGDEDLFPAGDKYDLGPLLDYGEASLSVADIEGLKGAECVGVKILLPGRKPETLEACRSDVIEILEERVDMLRRNSNTEVRLVEARLRFWFTESRRTRMATIKPPNVAMYSRDGDAGVVEAFLRSRGFITDRYLQPFLIDAPVLASG